MSSFRTLWRSLEIPLAPEEAEPVYTGIDCQSGVLSLCSYALIHRCSEDELHPELRFTGAGILAMANSGPNTNGTCILFLSTRPV